MCGMNLRDKIIYLLCAGFAVGVLWRSFFLFDQGPALLAAIISAAMIPIFALISNPDAEGSGLRPERRSKKYGIFVAVFALAFSLGVLRFNLADRPAPAVFENQAGQKVFLTGIITDEPDKKEANTNLTVETDGEEQTKILISVKKDEGYRYGDRISLTGKLEKPKNFLTDQGKEFNYVTYLRENGIFYVMYEPKIAILSAGHGNPLKTALFAAKEKFAAAINRAIPAPENILMGGLILGERSSFSQSLRQAFVNTGTIHIVTISGYNVTLVSDWIMRLLIFLPVNFATGSGIFAIFLFVIVTGGAQTAIRAGIMASLSLVAQRTGRIYNAARALALTGVAMTAINPFILAFDASFQLSFLATIAIIFFSPRVEKYFLWIKWKKIRDIITITCAVYIFVLPFIIYKMGNLSVVALPANFAILPLVPITMILGFLAGFAGLFSNILAFIPGKIAYLLLHYQLGAIGFFSRFSFAALSIPDFPILLVILVYAIFLYGLFGRKSRGKTTILVLLTPLVLTLAASGFLYYRHYQADKAKRQQLAALLINIPEAQAPVPFVADARVKTGGCVANGPLADHACSPGAIFKDAAPEQICVPGYTKTVRDVSTKLRKQIYSEYGVTYPQPRGAYEVDHLIPLAIGGSNDISNLFLEAAEPRPGFHEKDVVEIFLQQEVCAQRVALPIAQRQIANDWLSVYNSITPEQILAIKKKFAIP